MSVTDSPLDLPVLILNKNWQAYAADKTVRRAVEDMTSGLEVAPFRGMDIELATDGELIYANPVDWDTWIKLPVRPGDDFLRTGRQYIRAPRVIISSFFTRINIRPVKLSGPNIKKRDKYQCQYCHKFFTMEELNIDHVIPQHHGGDNSWTNMVCSCYSCNTKKGHKFNHEIGYKLLKTPNEPAAIPSTFIFTCKHPSWAPFLPHKA